MTTGPGMKTDTACVMLAEAKGPGERELPGRGHIRGTGGDGLNHTAHSAICAESIKAFSLVGCYG